MNYVEFLKLVDGNNAKASEQTLHYWHTIYIWVLDYGYADTADTPEFVQYMNAFRNTSLATLNTHLRRMSEAGLLKCYVLKRKLSSEAREEFFNPVLNMFVANKALPSSFNRYCLPNQQCSREFKSASRFSEEIERRLREFSVKETT